MLSGIKEKLLNVKKNVNLFSSDVKSSLTENLELYAGAEILDRYEQEWVQIHDMNEQNADAANKIAEGIDKVFKKMESDKENIQAITNILAQSNLCSTISLCLNQIQAISVISRKIEDDLQNVEILLEETKFWYEKAQHQRLLQQYQMNKTEALWTLRKQLSEEHQQKIVKVEAAQNKQKETRQKVYQQAFESDLERYKASGAVPIGVRESHSPSKESGAILEEIKLDYDQNELEKFLNE